MAMNDDELTINLEADLTRVYKAYIEAGAETVKLKNKLRKISPFKLEDSDLNAIIAQYKEISKQQIAVAKQTASIEDKIRLEQAKADKIHQEVLLQNSKTRYAKELAIAKAQQLKLDATRKTAFANLQQQNKLDLLETKAKYSAEAKGLRAIHTEVTKLDKAGFPHKLFTTTQYAIAGSMIYGAASAVRALAKETLAYDDAIYNNMAVLNASREEAVGLADNTRDLARAFGGSIKDIDAVTLTLGRAGVAVADLKDATSSVIALATITGDSFTASSEVMSSFITNFKEAGVSVNELADKLGYVANATKMGTEDLGTFANYGLQTSKSLGLTIDSISALTATMSNLGTNASTIGTQMQKLDFIFAGSGEKMARFWNIIKQDQSAWLTRLKSGDTQALVDFAKAIDKTALSERDWALATDGMEINQKKMLLALRNGSDLLSIHTDNLKHALSVQDQAMVKSLGASTLAERAYNSLVIAADGYISSLLDIGGVRQEITDLNAEYNRLATAGESTVEVSKKLKARIAEVSTVFNNLTTGAKAAVEIALKLGIAVGTTSLALKGFSLLAKAYTADVTAAALASRGLAFAMNTIPFVAVATGVYLLTDALLNNADAYKKIAQEREKASKGWTGLGTLEDRKFETATESIAKAYENLQAKKRAMDKMAGTQYAKYYAEQYLTAKESYDKQEKAYIAYANKINEATTTPEKLAEKRRVDKEKELAANRELYLMEVAQFEFETKRLRLLTELDNVGNKDFDRISANEVMHATTNKYLKEKLEIANRETILATRLEKQREIALLQIQEDIRYKKEGLALAKQVALLNIQRGQERSAYTNAQSTYDSFNASDTSLSPVSFAVDSNALRLLEEEKKLTTDQIELDILENEILAEKRNIIIANLQAAAEEARARELIGTAQEYEAAISSIQNYGLATEEVTKTVLEYRQALELLDAQAKGINFDIVGGFSDTQDVLAGIGNSAMDMSKAIRKASIEMANFNGTLSPESAKELAYGMLDGMSSISAGLVDMYDEEDKRRERQEKLVKALNVVKQAAMLAEFVQFTFFEEVKAEAAGATAVAVAAQSSPWTGLATAATMIGFLASIGIALSGSGSGGAKAAPVDPYEAKLKDLEMSNEPMLDRMDSQISLLEKIEQNGSASQLGLERALIDYQYNMDRYAMDDARKLANGDVTAKWGSYYTNYDLAKAYQSTVNAAFASLGDYGLTGGGAGTIWDTPNTFQVHTNMQPLIDTNEELLSYIVNRDAVDEILNKAGLPDLLSDTEFAKVVNDVQTIIYDFATAIGDSIDDLKDMSDSFKDIFDSITGTTKYADLELQQALEDVSNLIGNSTLPDYLESQITAIAELERIYGRSAQELLLSNNVDDIKDQAALVLDIQEITNTVFENGAKDALNYLDSIELVGSAMGDVAKLQEDIAKQINDAWMGSLSYLNDIQKLEYANNMLDSATNAEDRVAASMSIAEIAMRTSRTREEYIPAFNRYIQEIQNQADYATITDVNNTLLSLGDKLDAIDASVQSLEETTEGAAVYAP